MASIPAMAQEVEPTAGTGIVDTTADDDDKWDVDLDLADDPADTGRDDVVHLTSEGRATSDYAMSMVDVPDTDIDQVDTLEFSYFEGSNNTNAAPDEVWLVIEDGDGDRHIVFQRFDDGTVIPAQEWRTQEVAPTITGASPTIGGQAEGVWTEVAVDQPISDPRGFLDGLSSDDLTTLSEDLTAEFPDATVLAAGVGHGAPEGTLTTVDLFVDDLVFNGQTFEFPVSSVETASDTITPVQDRLTAFIDLPTAPGDATVEDINVSTVEMNGVPAIQGTAGPADTDGDGVQELRVQFDAQQVSDTVEAGQTTSVRVSGIFENEQFSFADLTQIRVQRLPSEAIQFDEDGDGEIDLGDLTNAAEAFARGDISLIELSRVAEAFALSG